MGFCGVNKAEDDKKEKIERGGKWIGALRERGWGENQTT